MDATKNESKSLLIEFTKEVEGIPQLITDALIKNANNEDEKNIITSLTPTLKNQFLEISNSIKGFKDKLSFQETSDVEQLLKASAAGEVTKSLKLALPSIGSLFGKLGIQEIIFAIKKLIRAIFGEKLPKWLDTVLNVIDEILNMLFGGDSPKVKNLLSMAEQNFLKEITLVTKLNQINFQGNKNDDVE